MTVWCVVFQIMFFESQGGVMNDTKVLVQVKLLPPQKNGQSYVTL